ncbi:hypothetical protein ANN_18731 [Periplaneta americana]|uniref:Uncharacterized protein n=1 Tax=Periplaneta americana TaxID=6978 RepID=A0ABQ8SPK6_PERAM|nr:hypothetical protein ANN_18731 [Periplaneta americana]
MAGLCEGGNESPGSLKASNTESYPAFARIGLRENPGKNLNQVTCPDQDSNPGHLVSRPDALTVTPQRRADWVYHVPPKRNKLGNHPAEATLLFVLPVVRPPKVG